MILASPYPLFKIRPNIKTPVSHGQSGCSLGAVRVSLDCFQKDIAFNFRWLKRLISGSPGSLGETQQLIYARVRACVYFYLIFFFYNKTPRLPRLNHIGQGFPPGPGTRTDLDYTRTKADFMDFVGKNLQELNLIGNLKEKP